MRAKLVIAGLLLALSAGGAWWFLPRGTKLSDPDSLLLAEFANTTGDPVFNSSLREALAVSLAQSPLLNLVSEEKVSEALSSQGRPSDAPVTQDLVRAICQRVGATVYLTGSIAKEGTEYPLRL
jgi:hypothetical protein